MEKEVLDKIIRQLTIEQKCALLAGKTAFTTRSYAHPHVPELNFSDGPHGLRKQQERANHLGIGKSIPATCFPTAVTLAQSWNKELLEEVGAALGNEATAQGVNVLLGPGVCIKRNPLCGRNFEYFSEDPYLAGKLAAAYVTGVQSQGIAACPKHFAVNSQETRRQASDSVLDQRTLHELYLTAFEIIVKEAKPKSIMSSYNLVNGEYANDSFYLLDDVLRKSWGFDGAVVTDWGGSNDHLAGVKAGSNFEMPAPGLDSTRELLRALKSGALDEKTLNQRVREALNLIFDTKEAVLQSDGNFDQKTHHELAKRAAAEGIVLLKNEDNILPLDSRKTVALLGDFAKYPRYQGAGSSLVNCTQLDNLYDELNKQDIKLLGYEPAFDRFGKEDDTKAEAAIDLAKLADVAVICLGLSEVAESEGLDREHINLDSVQLKLLERVAEVNSNVVVVLSSGSVVDTSWSASCKALVYLGLGGQAGAAACADVLLGKTNPSAKLAESWPLSLADVPSSKNFPSDEAQAKYLEGIYVGYRYYETTHKKVAFPFGYGLSYTSFVYSDLRVSSDASKVHCKITNTGDFAGAEVCQLYIGLPNAQVFRPKVELKGFTKVFLEPGETKDVEIELDEYTFRFFNPKIKTFEVEGGTYTIFVGSSVKDLALSTQVQIKGKLTANPYEGLELKHYKTGHVEDVSQREFETLLGHKLENKKIIIDRNICFRDLKHGRSPLFWLITAILSSMVKRRDANGRPNLNALFIYNMPIRALAKNAGQFISMGVVDAIVLIIKGWIWICLLLGIVAQFIWHNSGLSIAICLICWIFPLLFELIKNLSLNAIGEAHLRSLERRN